MRERERERERELPGRFRETEGQRGVEFTTVAILKRLLSRRMRWKSSCESAFQFSNIYFFGERTGKGRVGKGLIR